MEVTLNVPVSLSEALPSGASLVLTVTATADTASEVDYGSFTSGDITISSGRSGSISIPITDDDIIENEETFIVELSVKTAPLASLATVSIGSPSTATVTITDDDTGITIEFNSRTMAIAEGNSGSTPVTLTVRLSGNQLVEPLSITVATVDGTATAGEDYTAVNQTLTFPPMTAFHEIDIPIMITGDNSWGVDETFQVELSATDKPAGVTLGEPATVTIMNDDTVELLVTFRNDGTADTGARTASENREDPLELYFFIEASSGATESDMIIDLEENRDLSSLHGTSIYRWWRREFAMLDVDFRAPSPSPVTFPSGSVMEAMQTVRIEMIDDDENERDEMLSYRIITQPGVNLVPLSEYSDALVNEINGNSRFIVIIGRE